MLVTNIKIWKSHLNIREDSDLQLHRLGDGALMIVCLAYHQ